MAEDYQFVGNNTSIPKVFIPYDEDKKSMLINYNYYFDTFNMTIYQQTKEKKSVYYEFYKNNFKINFDEKYPSLDTPYRIACLVEKFNQDNGDHFHIIIKDNLDPHGHGHTYNDGYYDIVQIYSKNNELSPGWFTNYKEAYNQSGLFSRKFTRDYAFQEDLGNGQVFDNSGRIHFAHHSYDIILARHTLSTNIPIFNNEDYFNNFINNGKDIDKAINLLYTDNALFYNGHHSISYDALKTLCKAIKSSCSKDNFTKPLPYWIKDIRNYKAENPFPRKMINYCNNIYVIPNYPYMGFDNIDPKKYYFRIIKLTSYNNKEGIVNQWLNYKEFSLPEGTTLNSPPTVSLLQYSYTKNMENYYRYVFTFSYSSSSTDELKMKMIDFNDDHILSQKIIERYLPSTSTFDDNNDCVIKTYEGLPELTTYIIDTNMHLSIRDGYYSFDNSITQIFERAGQDDYDIKDETLNDFNKQIQDYVMLNPSNPDVVNNKNLVELIAYLML